MSDNIRKTLQNVDMTTRLATQMKEIERITNPLRGLSRELHLGGHSQAMLDAGKVLSQHQSVLASAFDTLNTQSGIFKLAAKINTQSGVLKKAIEQVSVATRIASSLENAILPDTSALASIAKQLSYTVPAIDAAYMVDLNWAKALQAQMEVIRKPWVLAEFSALSFEGFASISRLNIVLRHAEPFSEQTRDYIDAEIGDPIEVADDDGPDARDVAHIEAGMNGGLLAFPSNTSGDVLIQTKFVFKAEFAPIPTTIDGSDPGHIFHPGHNSLITTVEQNLRHVISMRMANKYGEEWLEKRVSGNLVAAWEKRRQEAIADGESPLHLIQYSNFMELKDIVIGGGHWKPVFEPVFIRKEHFVTSMDRLHPIRKPLAHSRPIGRGQQFHLISEAALILKALGIDIFKN
ncbi:MAG: hypothetical protein JKX71_14270 [Amylibacter sp.]|nr:hypothetical protein [Amylibacter sp.]